MLSWFSSSLLLLLLSSGLTGGACVLLAAPSHVSMDGLLVLKFCCFPTSLLGLVIVFYAGSFPWISVIPYVLRFTKLLGSCASGRGLLPETFTKVILSTELFYFAHMPTGYWSGLWCFVFL